jgi:rhodanese-related sulfurtransferase
LALIMVFSLVLAACGVEETPVVEEPAPTEVPVEVVVDEPEVMEPSDLDSAYGAILAEMPPYNTVKMDALAEELLEEPPPFLLDVRTVGEVEENGHIPGAVHAPLDELANYLDLLPSYDTPIVTYCAGGWRATIAMTYLSAAGWTDVRALKAKFSDWVGAGYAVDPGLPPEAFVLDAETPDAAFVAAFDEILMAREGWGGIGAEDLNLALADNPDLYLIDARTAGELEEKGTIEAANFAHIPLESFITDMAMWPADKDATITVYCGSGHRSTIAMAIMWTYGYTNVTSLSDGFGGWVDAGYPVVEYAAP